MKRLALVLFALPLIVSCLTYAWSDEKGHGRRRHMTTEEGEESSRRVRFGGEKAALSGTVRGLLDNADELIREAGAEEQMDKAASLANKALRISEENDMPAGIARANVLLGLICLWRTEFDHAMKYNNKAIDPAKRSGNCKALAAAVKNIGLAHRGQGRYDKAADSFTEAIAIAKNCGDKTIPAWAALSLGQVYALQGKYREAHRVLQEGLVLAQEIGSQEIEAYIRSAVGGVYTRSGRYARAADSLESALLIGERIRIPRVQMEALAESANLYLIRGEFRKAADYLQKTLDQARRRGEKRREASSLFGLGEVYTKWGRYADAVTCFREALAKAKSTANVTQEMRILLDMGKLSASLGQYPTAVELFDGALAISQKLGAAHMEGSVLVNLGRVHQRWGGREQALRHYEQGLEIFGRIGVPTRSIASDIGNLYLDMGYVEKAAPFIKQSGFSAPLGRLCLIKKEYDCAKDHYERLLRSAEENRNADDLFTAYTGLGIAGEGANDPSSAAEYYRKAVEYTEELRNGLDPAERETFFDVTIEGFYRTAPYEGLARVLVKLNRPVEAFNQSEYTRARIFAESISRRNNIEALDVPHDVRETDARITDQFASLSRNLRQAHENSDQEAVESLEPQVKEIKEQLSTHIRTLRNEYPLFAAVRYPQPMDLGQAALKNDEWVLEYHVTDPGLIIYLTHGKKLVNCVFKTISRKELDELVRRFREPMEMGTEDDILKKLQSFDFESGGKLADLLVGDALSLCPPGSPLIITPDDCLGVLPFEMLPLHSAGKISTDKEIPCIVDAEFFGDRYDVSYSQSVTALTLARTYATPAPTGRKLLIFADPVFRSSDSRYTEPENSSRATAADEGLHVEMRTAGENEYADEAGIQRLPLTLKLAESLTRMYGDGAECYTGVKAAKDRFLEIMKSGSLDYEHIVFATHGFFGKELAAVREPALALSLVPPGTDGFLRMSEVGGLKMNAGLVVLTACRTGLGRRISGEGTMGMGRAFQYSGAKCVLTSLWSVEQSASVGLVDSLFKHLREGKSRLDALKSARRDIRDQGWDHPFFWAAFVLVGEAR